MGLFLSCLLGSVSWCSFFPFGSFPESYYYSDADLVVSNAAATRAMALKMAVVTTLPENFSCSKPWVRETVRGWMSNAGLWLSRKQRWTFRQRLRRKAYGDMLADIKERQDQQAKPTIKSNSDKNGYVKHARRPGRRKDIMSDPTVIAERKKALLPLDAAE